MPTLRVEEPNETLDTPPQTVIQRAPQAPILSETPDSTLLDQILVRELKVLSNKTVKR